MVRGRVSCYDAYFTIAHALLPKHSFQGSEPFVASCSVFHTVNAVHTDKKIDAIYTCEFSTFCFYFLVRICCGFSLVPYYCNFPAEITASSLQKRDVLKPLRFLLTKLYNCKYCSNWYFVTNCQSNKKEKIRSR